MMDSKTWTAYWKGCILTMMGIRTAMSLSKAPGVRDFIGSHWVLWGRL